MLLKGKGKRRRSRRRKQLLDDLEESRGYCKLKEEALDRTVWKTGFGRGCRLARQTTEWMNERRMPLEQLTYLKQPTTVLFLIQN
jgi:hypothetical protein